MVLAVRRLRGLVVRLEPAPEPRAPRTASGRPLGRSARVGSLAPNRWGFFLPQRLGANAPRLRRGPGAAMAPGQFVIDLAHAMPDFSVHHFLVHDDGREGSTATGKGRHRRHSKLTCR